MSTAAKRTFRFRISTAPAYPPCDAFDRREFLIRVGGLLVASGTSACVLNDEDRLVPVRPDTYPTSGTGPDLRAAVDLHHDISGTSPDMAARIDDAMSSDLGHHTERWDQGARHDLGAVPDASPDLSSNNDDR